VLGVGRVMLGRATNVLRQAIGEVDTVLTFRPKSMSRVGTTATFPGNHPSVHSAAVPWSSGWIAVDPTIRIHWNNFRLAHLVRIGAPKHRSESRGRSDRRPADGADERMGVNPSDRNQIQIAYTFTQKPT